MPTRREQEKQDQVGKDSFPASDPPANSGITGPRVSRDRPDERKDDARPKGTPIHDRHATETAYHREDGGAR